ncbi:MAG: hypothetical protein A2Y02_00980 [Omnitrophica bacterium GWA2_52_12]|nr:MAG: hypothetical protein A2Y02_00980 [Omnitrophica bacterium GWA2_52_12]
MIAFLPWIPLAAALVVLFSPAKNERLLKTITLAACSLCSLSVLVYFLNFKPEGGFQFVIARPWLPAFGIQYKSGFDGINLTLCLLHALVSLAGAFVACAPKERLKEYLFYYLVLTGGIYGVFTSLDLFFLYVFFEMTLIPLFPMIGIWGSKNKEYGAMKLTLFITTGAVLAFFGLLLFYREAGIHSFDLVQLAQVLKARGGFSTGFQHFVAPMLIVGFGVIASLWPVHSWSPIGYAAAPTAVSMLHAGVLKKMGPYLILRVAVTFLPEGVKHAAPWLSILAGIGIVYAGLAAIRQSDMKYMVGFSSVSHMGYVLLGIAAMNSVSLSGTVLLMFSHGVMAACAFAAIGFLYERTHVRNLHDFGGLAKSMPFLALSLILACLASLGLPGFSNFVSELLVFIGAWRQFPAVVIAAVFGVLITAIYLLRAVREVCYGKPNPRWAHLKDAQGFAERFPFILLLGALLIAGIWPRVLLRVIEPAVGALLS